jgi:uncharacterized SAM-binding protein YcdF (DUF218 family)
VLKSILLSLCLPPVCFLLIALAGFWIGRRHLGAARALTIVGLSGLTILSLPVVTDAMITSLERNLPLTPPPDARPEAIVILGGDVARITEPPFVRSGRLTLDRLRAGAGLHRATGLPLLVTGGIVQWKRPSIAALMASSLREEFQVPVTWVEDASADTWENAKFSADILKKQGIRSVYLVTQPWHMRRAVMAFQRTGLIVTAFPTSLDPPFDPMASDFLPHAFAWQVSYFALHEWIGCAWYAVR